MMIEEKLQSEEGKSPLKALRERLGNISQEELARRLGTSVVSISRWERRVKPMSLTVPQIRALLRELRSANWDMEAFLEESSSYENAEA
ncbi:XRE family transcriptional regulator [Phormidesmis priestleyi ULC007]|uniref:XRE family transcriptional regulator n=2 Tax=Phormidesmis priestleyi TaxID=268141 RepID=A0A2T1DD90_9CYAN|nr:XRE family transcriptional regulator [Phormidesmis priestleyi ULC007]PZO48849.1 MAG: XRE family transcriptional regulator [Phormidesmis priestleyi]